MIIYGAVGVIAVIAVIVIIGIIISTVLPPRGTALTVGDRSYTVRDVSDRAIAGLRLQAIQGTTMAGVIDDATEHLIRQELLRQAGGPIVGTPSAEDVEAEIRERLNIAAEAPQQEYETVLRDHLSQVGVSRARFEEIIGIEVMADRMRDHFAEEIPEAGPQVHILVASSLDRMSLEELRERVAAGEDFTEVAVELGFAEPDSIDAGWVPLDAVDEEVRAAIEDLEPGETSESVVPPNSLRAVVYYVADRDEEREYDEFTREQLKTVRLNRFLTEQRDVVGVEIDLSQGERDWIARQIENSLT